MNNNENKDKKTRKPKVIEIIGYIAIFIIIILLTFVIISNLSGNITFIFGKTVCWVLTPSMEPTIPERSYILVSEIDAKDVKVGDVIMFYSDDPALKGMRNTHRVIEIIGNNEEFVMKGDNNLVKDEYTAKAPNVVGKYEKNLDVLTAIGRFMYSKMGLIVSLTLILGIVMLMYIPDIIKSTKEKTKIIEEKKQETIDILVRQEVERLKRENAQIDDQGEGEENQ